MTPNVTATASDVVTSSASLAVSIIGLLIILRLFQNLRKDGLRDRLFEIRDNMFLYAVSEDLLNDPAYQSLRLMANKLIRFADRIALMKLLLLQLIDRFWKCGSFKPSLMIEWEEAMSILPKEQSARLTQYHADLQDALIRHLVGSWISRSEIIKQHLRIGFIEAGAFMAP